MLKTNNKKNNYYKNMIIQEINKKKFRDQKKKEKIENDFKTFYNRTFESIIPFKIYQAWHSDDIPDSVIYCIDNIKKSNPEFEHFLFNNNKCREFIKENFSKETLDAYDSIIPNAIKIDLWRYCILYMNGGIYLDVKYFCINNFKFKYLTDNEYFCRDIAESGSGIYNALIICKPKNEIMLKCINQVLENVKNNFYGDYSLEPTGPLMIKNFFSNDEVNNLNLSLNEVKNNIYIIYNNLPILYFNKNYRKEQIKYQKHWTEFWNDRNFYIKKTDETHSEVFTKIYETKFWGNNNNDNYSGSSGSGSNVEEQINTYVPFLISFIKLYNINTIIDLGCGDFKVGKIIYNDSDIKYYGYDVYKKIIEFHNKETVLNEENKYTFTHLDFYKDKSQIINADLCIIKDVLMHWSLDKIYCFLDYVIENKKFKYILIINDCLQIEDNTNINDGEFRELSANFYPLKKYNPVIIYNYEPKKEVSLITI